VKDKIAKLPKWAREHIAGLERKIQNLQGLANMHALLSDKDRDWHTIRPSGCKSESWNGFQLFSLHENQAVHQVSLYEDDVLYIGRGKKR